MHKRVEVTSMHIRYQEKANLSDSKTIRLYQTIERVGKEGGEGEGVAWLQIAPS